MPIENNHSTRSINKSMTLNDEAIVQSPNGSTKKYRGNSNHKKQQSSFRSINSIYENDYRPYTSNTPKNTHNTVQPITPRKHQSSKTKPETTLESKLISAKLTPQLLNDLVREVEKYVPNPSTQPPHSRSRNENAFPSTAGFYNKLYLNATNAYQGKKITAEQYKTALLAYQSYWTSGVRKLSPDDQQALARRLDKINKQLQSKSSRKNPPHSQRLSKISNLTFPNTTFQGNHLSSDSHNSFGIPPLTDTSSNISKRSSKIVILKLNDINSPDTVKENIVSNGNDDSTTQRMNDGTLFSPGSTIGDQISPESTLPEIQKNGPVQPGVDNGEQRILLGERIETGNDHPENETVVGPPTDDLVDVIKQTDTDKTSTGPDHLSDLDNLSTLDNENEYVIQYISTEGNSPSSNHEYATNCVDKEISKLPFYPNTDYVPTNFIFDDFQIKNITNYIEGRYFTDPNNGFYLYNIDGIDNQTTQEPTNNLARGSVVLDPALPLPPKKNPNETVELQGTTTPTSPGVKGIFDLAVTLNDDDSSNNSIDFGYGFNIPNPNTSTRKPDVEPIKQEQGINEENIDQQITINDSTSTTSILNIYSNKVNSNESTNNSYTNSSHVSNTTSIGFDIQYSEDPHGDQIFTIDLDTHHILTKANIKTLSSSNNTIDPIRKAPLLNNTFPVEEIKEIKKTVENGMNPTKTLSEPEGILKSKLIRNDLLTNTDIPSEKLEDNARILVEEILNCLDKKEDTSTLISKLSALYPLIHHKDLTDETRDLVSEIFVNLSCYPVAEVQSIAGFALAQIYAADPERTGDLCGRLLNVYVTTDSSNEFLDSIEQIQDFSELGSKLASELSPVLFSDRFATMIVYGTLPQAAMALFTGIGYRHGQFSKRGENDPGRSLAEKILSAQFGKLKESCSPEYSWDELFDFQRKLTAPELSENTTVNNIHYLGVHSVENSKLLKNFTLDLNNFLQFNVIDKDKEVILLNFYHEDLGDYVTLAVSGTKAALLSDKEIDETTKWHKSFVQKLSTGLDNLTLISGVKLIHHGEEPGKLNGSLLPFVLQSRLSTNNRDKEIILKQIMSDNPSINKDKFKVDLGIDTHNNIRYSEIRQLLLLSNLLGREE